MFSKVLYSTTRILSYSSGIHRFASLRGISNVSQTANGLEQLLTGLNSKSSADELMVASSTVLTEYEQSKTDEAKKAVLVALATNCGVRHDALENAISLYTKNKSMAHEVHSAACPMHYNVLQNIGNLPDGIKSVCNMRARLRTLIKTESDKTVVSSLRRLEASCRSLLTIWFCLSNLHLNRLTWESPGDILQKIAKYEAVHPVRGLTDFRKRLGSHRRCFYFSHEAMPREPLVMVHVALMNKIADSVQEIISGTESNVSEESVNTSIYYSITSTQKGLAGIDLGNMLIKRVAAQIQSDVPSISAHSTLSPIPGFRAWLLRSLQGHAEYGDVVDDRATSLISEAVKKDLTKEEAQKVLLKAVSINHFTLDDLDLVEPFKKVIMYMCAMYLYRAKRNGYAVNSVANFHLRNGAELYRLNWRGDTSVRGVASSLGIMANYRYYLDRVPENSSNYTKEKTITAHPNVLNILEY